MQKKKNIFIVLILSIFLISIVYGAGSCKAGNGVTQLSGDWTVIMVDDLELNPEDVSKGSPFIRFDPSEGMISGNTGCNDFTGDAVYTDNTIEIGGITRTEIACQNMEIEERLLKILDNKIVTFSLDGDTLVLNNTAGKLTLILKSTGQESGEEEPGNGHGTGEPGEEPDAGDEDIINTFNELLDEGVRSYQLISFIDEKMTEISPEGYDILLEKLEMAQKEDIQYYTDLLFEDDWQNKLNTIFRRDIESEDLVDIDDMQLKELMTEIFQGGFKLVALEGSFYPYIDYEFLKKYSEYLSPMYFDYINVMALESNKVSSRDAALTISWDELALRLINSEEFLINYPDETIRKRSVGDLYMRYLVSYTIGQNNTPAYDYDDKTIHPEVLESYDELILEYPDYMTADLVRSYKEILAETDNIVNESVLEEINDIYREAVLSFKLDSPPLLLEGVRNTYYQTPLSENGYVILINGEYLEKGDSGSANDVLIKLSDYYAFGDFDGDGINDAAAILTSSGQNGEVAYSLTLNLNRYFYFQNVPDIIIGNSTGIEIKGIEIEENRISINIISDDTEETLIYGVVDNQFVEN